MAIPHTSTFSNNHEEFLAVMITNGFRSEKGAKKFNRDYMTGTLVSQCDLEIFLSSSPDYLKAVASFLPDMLVKCTIPLAIPFNPFRDYKRLQADYAARISNAFIPRIMRH